jgi:hypothetical protein
LIKHLKTETFNYLQRTCIMNFKNIKMKTTLLKKIRAEHPIYFDSNTKLYQYKTQEVHLRSGGIWEHEYKSKWVKDYRTLLNKRRELILKKASLYFFDRWFCYKRKRARIINRVF